MYIRHQDQNSMLSIAQIKKIEFWSMTARQDLKLLHDCARSPGAVVYNGLEHPKKSNFVDIRMYVDVLDIFLIFNLLSNCIT